MVNSEISSLDMKFPLIKFTEKTLQKLGLNLYSVLCFLVLDLGELLKGWKDANLLVRVQKMD